MKWQPMIYHEPSERYAFPISTDTLVLTVKAKQKDVQRCFLISDDFWRSKGVRKAEMLRIALDGMFDYFTIKVKAPSKSLHYLFRVDTCEEKFWYSCAGITSKKPERDYFFQLLYIRDNDVVSVPEWANGAVFYQIFPSSFYNGDESNDPPNKQP